MAKYKPRPPKPCVICGEEVIYAERGRGAKTCSEECSQERARQKRAVSRAIWEQQNRDHIRQTAKECKERKGEPYKEVLRQRRRAYRAAHLDEERRKDRERVQQFSPERIDAINARRRALRPRLRPIKPKRPVAPPKVRVRMTLEERRRLDSERQRARRIDPATRELLNARSRERGAKDRAANRDAVNAKQRENYARRKAAKNAAPV